MTLAPVQPYTAKPRTELKQRQHRHVYSQRLPGHTIPGVKPTHYQPMTEAKYRSGAQTARILAEVIEAYRQRGFIVSQPYPDRATYYEVFKLTHEYDWLIYAIFIDEEKSS